MLCSFSLPPTERSVDSTADFVLVHGERTSSVQRCGQIVGPVAAQWSGSKVKRMRMFRHSALAVLRKAPGVLPVLHFLLHQVACLYTDKRGKRLIRHILTCRRRSRRTESANPAGPRRSPHLAAAADIFAEQCLPIHGNRRRYQFAPKTGHVGQCSTWLPH